MGDKPKLCACDQNREIHERNDSCLDLPTPSWQEDLETLALVLPRCSTLNDAVRFDEALSRLKARMEEQEQTIQNYKEWTAEYLKGIEFSNVKSREALAELGQCLLDYIAKHPAHGPIAQMVYEHLAKHGGTK